MLVEIGPLMPVHRADLLLRMLLRSSYGLQEPLLRGPWNWITPSIQAPG